jgi:ribosomal protein S18 acetylase RimI-like enzyme
MPKPFSEDPIKIRGMRDRDLDPVREVDSLAFSEWWQALQGENAELPQRTRANVSALREKDPQGCFVAEVDGSLVGFIFSCTWGSVGWLGPFAILPAHQGQGIGKRLLQASLGYLRQDPNRVIGLSTMPESPHNLGLYLKTGFQARFLTLLLSKPLEGLNRRTLNLPHWSEADPLTQDQWLADLREATDRIHPGLDYAKEIHSTAHHDFGHTVVLTKNKQAVGMSILHLQSSLEGKMGESTAVLQVLILHPSHTEGKAFRTILEGGESLASLHGKRRITIAVNTRHTWAVEQALRVGYRVERAALRMILTGTDAGPSLDGHVDLSRWAG